MTISVLDTSSTEPRRQFDLFYEAVRRQIVRVSPERPPCAAAFPARLISRTALGRTCHLIDAPGHIARRTPADIGSSDPEEIHLNCMLSGSRGINLSRGEAVAAAGQIFAMHCRRPFDLLGEGGRYRALKIVIPAVSIRPQERLRSVLPADLAAHRLAGLLTLSCRKLAEAISEADDHEFAALADIAEWLFRLILGSARAEAPEGRRQDLFRLISLETERRLDDAGFSLDALCARLGLSRRRVQRVLARNGTTFSDLLRSQRMERARHRLTSTRLSVEDVAWECGYTETSAFYRAFRRHFGVAPGTLRPGSRAP